MTREQIEEWFNQSPFVTSDFIDEGERTIGLNTEELFSCLEYFHKDTTRALQAEVDSITATSKFLLGEKNHRIEKLEEALYNCISTLKALGSREWFEVVHAEEVLNDKNPN